MIRFDCRIYQQAAFERFASSAAGPFSFLDSTAFGPRRTTAFFRIGSVTGLHHLCTVLAEDWQASQ